MDGGEPAISDEPGQRAAGGLDFAGELLRVFGQSGGGPRERGFVGESRLPPLGVEIREVVRELVDNLGLARDRERRQVVPDVLVEIHGALSDRLDPGNPVERRQQLVPVRPLLGEHLAARGRQPIVAAAPLAGLFDPFPVDPPTTFHPIEHRIQRRDVEPKDAAGAIVDQLSDFVPMSGRAFEDREDHQFGAAAFELVLRGHMLSGNIWRR